VTSPARNRRRAVEVPPLLEAFRADVEARASRAGEPADLARRRREASELLTREGFPHSGVEAYRFTDVRAVLAQPHRVVPPARPELPGGNGGATSTLVLENGLPTPLRPHEGRGLRLRWSGSPERADIAERLGELAPSDSAFVAQNTALFGEALLVEVEPGARASLRTVTRALASVSPVLAAPRTLVVAREGSSLEWIDALEGEPEAAHLSSGVTEIFVEAGARVEHVRVAASGPRRADLTTIAARVATGGRYVSRLFSLGGALTRVDLRVELRGEGASTVLDGLSLADSGELVDHHTHVRHAAPGCTTEELHKGIVSGQGHVVFDGVIHVAKGARGTVAHQQSRNLVLSRGGRVNTKPHLEIDHDDVKCSHGATVGRLDPAQLFYLRARGLPEAEARATLVLAFAREMVERIPDRRLGDELGRRVAARLPGGTLALEAL